MRGCDVLNKRGIARPYVLLEHTLVIFMFQINRPHIYFFSHVFVITEVCRLVVTNLRRKSVHALTFGGDFELKFRACANSRRKICDNQANLCIVIIFQCACVNFVDLWSRKAASERIAGRFKNLWRNHD